MRDWDGIGLVYYLLADTEFGHLVKIGYSTLLPERVKSLYRAYPWMRSDDLLGVELGGCGREHRRHRQFSQYRAFPERRDCREWYFPAEPIMTHALTRAPVSVWMDRPGVREWLGLDPAATQARRARQRESLCDF